MTTRVRITERLAASLQWQGRAYYVWDTDLEGFGVRVWGPDNRRGYIIQTGRGKQSFRKALGKVGEVKVDAARAAAIAYRGAVKSGRDPNAEDTAARQAWTLDDAMTYFRGSYADARKLSAEYKADSGALFDHHTPDRWKGMKLTAVTQPMVVTRHGQITDGTIDGTGSVRGGTRRANAWLSLMSRLFTLGIQEGHCTSNPTVGIKKNEETHRERLLSEAEIETLWNYCETHKNVEAAVCVQFMLLTGCRPREAYRMEWTHLDKTTWQWTKPAANVKRRKAHTITLGPMAIAALARLDTYKRSDYVFPSPEDATQPRGDKLKAFWRYVRKHCALPDVNVYDCRHSFGSWLAMRGASELSIAAQLHHASLQTTKRYVHFNQGAHAHKCGHHGGRDRERAISGRGVAPTADHYQEGCAHGCHYHTVGSADDTRGRQGLTARRRGRATRRIIGARDGDRAPPNRAGGCGALYQKRPKEGRGRSEAHNVVARSHSLLINWERVNGLNCCWAAPRVGEVDADHQADYRRRHNAGRSQDHPSQNEALGYHTLRMRSIDRLAW